MSLIAHNSEFSSLVTAWLDETATPEEAAQLWQAVAENPDCALEFAAAARFESLLAATVQERAQEKTAQRQLFATDIHTPLQAARRNPGWLISKMPLRAAAVLAVLGLASWLLWPKLPPAEIAQTTDAQPQGQASVTPPRPPQTPRRPLLLPPPPDVASAPEGPVPERLDRFFLPGLAFHQMPLNEVLGILQGHLQDLNYLNSAALANLRITVPTDAAGRRITFESGPIAFLKAVRAVAALGGCEVTVNDDGVVLNLHRGTFPQVPERRDLQTLLAGRVNGDGTEAVTDPDRIAALVADAASLGIALDPNQPLEEQTFLPVTRGQWAALQALTDTRDQLSQLPLPSFQLYVSEGDPNPTNQVIDASNVDEVGAEFERLAIEPAAVVTPSITPLVSSLDDSAATSPIITIQPVGEVTQVTASLFMATTTVPIAATAELQTALVTRVLLAGQGMSFSVDSTAAATFSSLSNVTVSRTGSIQVTLLPVTNIAQP